MTLEEQIVKLNEIKREFNSRRFTQRELKEVLKKNGFKSINQLLIGMTKCNIITSIVGEGTVFTQVGVPIYIKTLERAIRKGLDKQIQYQKTYMNNKQKAVVQNTLIEDAIKLLKENGYKVYKPTTTFEEI